LEPNGIIIYSKLHRTGSSAIRGSDGESGGKKKENASSSPKSWHEVGTLTAIAFLDDGGGIPGTMGMLDDLRTGKG
jgi:hypothetical protein